MQESQQTPETVEQPGAETRGNVSELEQITELLDGGKAEESVEPESEASSEGSKRKAKPTNLVELAEALDVEVADLYALEIPFDVNGESTPKTLGQIKDAFKESDAIAVDRLTWEETKAAEEQKLAKATTELQELVGLLPKSAISQELLQTVARRRADAVQREMRLTRNVIPEWKNEDVESADRTEMSEYLTRYGFPPNYLEAIVDHKTVHFIRDSVKRALRVEKALEQVETIRKAGHKPSGRSGKAPKKPAPRRNARNDQVDAVVEILSTG